MPWIKTAAGVRSVAPGVALSAAVSLAGYGVAARYGAPAMLFALLFGVALNFLADAPSIRPGVEFGAKGLLRFGVALLGARIGGDVLLALGWPVVGMVAIGVCATIASGILFARLFGFDARFGLLTAGAVAICGASAALAIAAALPKDAKSEERLVFTVVGVTLLSTVAMIAYPVILDALRFDDRSSGVFIGATVHDVAQVVGAGFSISDAAGETSTLVKLLRVVLLAPVVVLATLAFRRPLEATGARPPVIPGFVAGFVALAALRTLGVLPEAAIDAATAASSACLLVAIASVGLKTVPRDVMRVGAGAAGLLVAQTLFLAAFALAAIGWLGVAEVG